MRQRRAAIMAEDRKRKSVLFKIAATLALIGAFLLAAGLLGAITLEGEAWKNFFPLGFIFVALGGIGFLFVAIGKVWRA
jgi:hypothetical protein